MFMFKIFLDIFHYFKIKCINFGWIWFKIFFWLTFFNE